MQENSNLSVLVIDPNPGMRSNLQNMLNASGISKVEYAVNAGTAVRQLTRRGYDIVLCEYDLGSGEGQDGQQLLEDLRHHRLIRPWSIFIMLTSEAVYGKVIGAAELAPTDYVLKPFTAETLGARIARALERRALFLPTYQLIAQNNLREAIRSAAAAEIAHPRHALEFARLRAELHVNLGEHGEAEEIYRKVLAWKPLGWAGLGLARTQFALGQVDDARETLQVLVAANPRLMAAYDLLARCHEAAGNHAQAQKILEEAVAISPHMVRRLRKLGEVALEAGDAAAAEKSFRQVVTKARYSEFRDPEDHVRLVKVLVKRGDVLGAAGVVRELERSMKTSPELDACVAVAHAAVHDAAGNRAGALSDLQAAVGAVRNSSGLSTGLKLGLVRACLDHRFDKGAQDVMMAVVNDQGSGVSAQDALDLFLDAGRRDLVDGVQQQIKAQAQILLGVADEKRNMGDVRGAVQTLLEALHMAPSNLQVVIAVAGGVLRQINELGWDHPLGELCLAQLEKIRAIDAQHPRLAPLEAEYAAMRRKYGITG
ncbi:MULTISPECIES: response regulator [unclassified Massilia]|uniref:response regulator n=1 Tax=unclassified Massilia TaxID=2609279 RepID=UPI00177AACE5|nr:MULTISPECIES: response regulator [unclassified Massilia]MBD8531866.1 tetratricopeptide repeat protein [Massilia sp. CFBP 13647]MBD8675311.1 tetratricopeptide repeat protein [Massilia sp. CFBP 13721]